MTADKQTCARCGLLPAHPLAHAAESDCIAAQAARIAELERAEGDAISLACEIADGVTHSSACRGNCVRCRLEASEAERDRAQERVAALAAVVEGLSTTDTIGLSNHQIVQLHGTLPKALRVYRERAALAALDAGAGSWCHKCNAGCREIGCICECHEPAAPRPSEPHVHDHLNCPGCQAVRMQGIKDQHAYDEGMLKLKQRLDATRPSEQDAGAREEVAYGLPCRNYDPNGDFDGALCPVCGKRHRLPRDPARGEEGR